MKIVNDSKKSLIAGNAKRADTFFSRMVGLLNRESLSEEEALIITKCNSIHMFFMKFAIDVLFISKSGTVVGIVKGIKPNRLSPVFWKASYSIELAEGRIEKTHTAIGDRISIV